MTTMNKYDNTSEENTFTLLCSDGTERAFQILFEYYCEENDNNYIAYTDEKKDRNGNVEVYASIVQENQLIPIKTEQEWQMIETILVTIQEECAKAIREYEDEIDVS